MRSTLNASCGGLSAAVVRPVGNDNDEAMVARNDDVLGSRGIYDIMKNLRRRRSLLSIVSIAGAEGFPKISNQ